MDRDNLEWARTTMKFLLTCFKAEDFHAKTNQCEDKKICPQQLNRELIYEQSLETAIKAIEDCLSRIGHEET